MSETATEPTPSQFRCSRPSRCAAASCARCFTATPIDRRKRAAASGWRCSPSRRSTPSSRAGSSSTRSTPDSHGARRIGTDAVATARPDVLDRRGEMLATDVRTPSLFGEPKRLIDVDEAVELLTAVMPDLDAKEVRDRLGNSKRGFAWLRREITPKQQQDIYKLGIPGIGFLNENKRIYPNGAEVAHLIGLVNVDNQGIAGIEKWLDGNGLAALHAAGLATDRLQEPVQLSIDLRAQHAMRDELLAARDKFKAKAAAGVITDVRTGEILAMVSVPDFDPNNPKEASDPTRINRLTTGVFEMGSTFKALTRGDGPRLRQVQSQLDARCARLAALRQVQHQRLSRAEARAEPAGGVHLFVEHRHRARSRSAWASSTTNGS